MKKKLLSLLLALSGFYTYGQLQVGLESNSQWYVDDNKIKLSENDAEERFRSGNYLKADYYLKKWEFGVQLESYAPKAPMNYNELFDKFNVGTIYTRFNDTESGVDATVGHFYDQFGSGLAFRSWEDRQLGINNAVFGARINYTFADQAIKSTLLGGRQRIGMGFDLAKSMLYGANLEVSLSDLMSMEDFELALGASYVLRYENITDLFPNADKTTTVTSARVDLGKGGFHWGVEYAFKSKDLPVEFFEIQNDLPKRSGSALLMNMGYSQKGFGVTANLRRMENFSFYSERGLAGNLYNQGVVNYIPALTKQYDFSLQNIYVYQAQPNLTFIPLEKSGEIGGQVDLFYTFEQGSPLGGQFGTEIALNGSYWSGLKNSNVDLETRNMDVEFLEFGQKYYSDLGIEITKRWTEKWDTKFSYLKQYYHKKYVEDTFGEVNSHFVGAEATYRFGTAQSVRLQGQHIWVDEDKKNWAGAMLEYNLNSTYGFFVNDIYNYGNEEEEQKIHYYNVGMSYTKSKTRVSVSYGRQRGGLLCVGGVCRMVSEAAGLTVGISTAF
ncbi:DUF6029 family protein [Flavobacterium sp. NKUCC04_CG]|uniref:DUF6029 family protein n=1 Tax=Flavobacterium sp. NKUCC04_CG TaxID=2842121 RepID=UPI001C5B64C0|nr:DUF6029 family protein [Flavobacterium sp. NKUCC04_CG]MBW3519932.1 hypothetical protein [Flavobacterium sp. NKUCC04_CG]